MSKHSGIMKMGPNNARCIIRALGEFFKFLIVFFIYTNLYLLYIQVVIETRDREGSDDENGPKQCVYPR